MYTCDIELITKYMYLDTCTCMCAVGIHVNLVGIQYINRYICDLRFIITEYMYSITCTCRTFL